MIKKTGSKYKVVSEKTGRSFGTYSTKKEAERRLSQVEYFKHAKGKKGGAKKSGAKKKAAGAKRK